MLEVIRFLAKHKHQIPDPALGSVRISVSLATFILYGHFECSYSKLSLNQESNSQWNSVNYIHQLFQY